MGKICFCFWGWALLLGGPCFLWGQTFTQSTLPIVKISTGGQGIPDEPKITARWSIVDNGPGRTNFVSDPGNVYDGPIGIERRGASSGGYPQASYAVELRKEDGSEQSAALFGWPEESDWTLISNYNDRSLMRNLLSYRMFQGMGHYAPRARLVEVTLNGEYRGIYLFCERIKRDKGRVDIAKMDGIDLAGDALTGGYIFKIDYFDGSNSWQSAYASNPPFGRPIHFVYYTPKPTDIQAAQKSYLQNFVNNMEKALYGNQFTDPSQGYRQYLDVESFIDYLIVQEVARNIDGFKKSSYFWKDRDSEGGLLHAGPVWDFDWAWKNIDECDIFRATNGSGFAYRINDCNGDIPAPGWFPRLLRDTFFANRLRCRYDTLRKGLLSSEQTLQFMDSIALSVQSAQMRHFARWNILGINTGTPEVPPIPTSYTGEISKLKTWIQLRLAWLDRNLPGRCGATPSAEPPKVPLQLVPNPAAPNHTVVQGRAANQTHYALYDVAGRTIRPLARFIDAAGTIDLVGLPNGVYLIRLAESNGKTVGPLLRLVVEGK